MSGIWAVKDKEDSGQIKFQKLSTVSEQIEFSKLMLGQADLTQSANSMSLAEKIADMAPTRENVEEVSAYMQEQLKKAFQKAGLALDPPVTFSTGADGSLSISGDRADMEKVRNLFENNESLAQDMKDFMAFADQMPAYERMLEYQIKCENAENDLERKLLDEEYKDLFDGKDHYDTSFTLSNDGFDMNVEFVE